MALKRKIRKKSFTIAEANATLPLLRSILRDLIELAQQLRDRYQHLTRLQGEGHLDQAHQEEIQVILAEYEHGQEKMKEYLPRCIQNIQSNLIKPDLHNFARNHSVFIICVDRAQPVITIGNDDLAMR